MPCRWRPRRSRAVWLAAFLLGGRLAWDSSPLAAEPVYGPADLAGTWSLHVLSGAGASTSLGSTLRGVVDVDAGGRIVAGAVTHPDGSVAALTGGNLSVTPRGLLTGTFEAGPALATIVEARVLRDRQTIVGVIAGGDLGDVEGADFGLFTLTRDIAGAGTGDLSGTWRYHELRTPATAGTPPDSLVGSLTFVPPGTIAAGTLADAGGGADTPAAGVLTASPAGEVTGALTALASSTVIHGQLTPSRDLVTATTSSNSSAVGMALLSRVPGSGGFVAADAEGPWRLYALALDGAAGNHGTFLTGGLTFDAGAGLFRARIADAFGAATALTGPFAVDPATGRIEGTLTGAGDTALDLDVTLRAGKDGATGVLTLTAGAVSQRGLVALVQEPGGDAVAIPNDAGTLSFAAEKYTVAEGNKSVTVVVQRKGTALSGGVTVQYAVVGGTATAGVDYAPVGGTLTFGVNATSASFVVRALDDRLVEGPETIVLRLGNASAGAVIGAADTTVTITDDDVGGTVQFGKPAFEVGENGVAATITVTRTGGKAAGVSVEYEIGADTDTARLGVDYTGPVTGVLTFAADAGTATFQVAVINRPAAEGDRALTLRLKNPRGGAVLSAIPPAKLTIRDDEVGVRFSAAAYTMNEDGKAATITVLRTGPATAEASVAFATADGTAVAGADYEAASGRLTFKKGETSRTFTVKIVDDALVEESETVLLLLSTPVGAILGPVTQATLTIADNDRGGTIRLASANLSVKESAPGGMAQAVVTVTRDGGAAIAVVDYATGDGTAQAGRHYAPTSGQLTFGSGDRSRTILVPILDNRVADGPRTFMLTLTNVSTGAALGSPSQVHVTILDDDNGGVVQFNEAGYRVTEPGSAATAAILITVERLGDNLAGGVSVQYAAHDGSAVADAALVLGDYVPTAGQLVFGPGEKLKAFEVTVRGDTVLEANETVVLTLSDPHGGATLGARATSVLTIVDASPSFQFDRAEYGVAEAAGSVTLTVMRSGPVDDTLIVAFATADIPPGASSVGRARAGSSYKETKGTLTFRPSQSSATFTIPIVDDKLASTPPQSFRAVLSNARKPSTGEAISLGAISTVLVTIRENPVPVVQFAGAEHEVREGGSVTVTVLRSENLTGTIVVGWAAPPEAAGDLSPASGLLTFPPNTPSRTITVKAVADKRVEGRETFVLGFTSFAAVTGPTPVAGAQATVPLIVEDADLGGTVALAADAFIAAEGTPPKVNTAKITLVRTGGAGGDVTVHFATVDGSAIAGTDYMPVQRPLTFVANETKKIVEVELKSNPVPGADRTFGVVLSQPLPAGLVALGRAAATVTITDAQSRVAFGADAYRVIEGQLAKITLTRTPPLTGEVSVRYSTSSTAGPGRAVAGVDYEPVTGGLLTIPANKASATFDVVKTIPNGLNDGARALTLTLSDPVGASLGRATAELTIDDDERPGVLAFAQGAYVVVEGQTAALEVLRSGGASGAVTVRYEVVGGSAGAGDFTLASGTLTFANGDGRAVITVPTIADGAPEGTETIVVQLADPGNGATLGALTATTLFVIDAEQTVAFSASDFSVDEASRTGSVTVMRGGVPDGPVSVRFRTVGGTADPSLDYVPVNAALDFAAGEVTKTVAIEIRGTAKARSGNRTVELALEALSGAVLGPRGTATLTIVDFRPDLIVLTINPSTAVTAGKLLGAPLRIQNVGREASPAFQVGVFMAKSGTPGADQPGAGRLLVVRSVGGLGAGASTGFDLSIGIDDSVSPGEYFMSAVADFSQSIGESDEGNNGRGSAPAIFRVNRNTSKYTVATAEIVQGDVLGALGGRAFVTAIEGGCDAAGNVSLNGSFQIVSQIGTLAEATATLTGTFEDQPVRYVLSLGLDIGDDDGVRGSFKILSIQGAFAGTGGGSLTGALVNGLLLGNVSGSLITSTPRVCQFAGTLRASGDPSVTLAVQQRAVGGRFAGGVTPALEPAAQVGEYLATFRATFDGQFPPPSAVTFTGPAGARLAGTPASARRSTLDEAAASADYVSPLIARPDGAPGGAWAVSYRGTPRLFTLPEPGTKTRLILPVPTVTVGPGGVLTAIAWKWTDSSGTPITVRPYVDRVRISLEPSAGPAPLYESPPMARGNTSHTLTAPVLWEDVAEVAMLYVDSVTGFEYRVAYPRAVRASVDLAFEHARDKTGTQEAQRLTVTFQAPAGFVSSSTPGVVTVSGGPFIGDLVPFVGQTLAGGVATDVFRLRRDVTGTPPALDTRLVVGVAPLGGAPRSLVTSVRNRATAEAVEVTSPAGTREADAMLGAPRAVTWTLPRAAAAGGFDVEAVTLNGLVRVDEGAAFCAAAPDAELGPDATAGVVTLPTTCFGQPVESAQVCVTILGVDGERTDACQGFGPDDDAVLFESPASSVAEGGEALVTVVRQGPRRRLATVRFATVAGGTARAADDYDPVSGTLTFEAGVRTATFKVKAKTDRLVDGDVTVLLRLSEPSGTLLDAPSQATLTIEDADDGGAVQFEPDRLTLAEGKTGQLTVVRKGTKLAGNVSVDYAVIGGTANAADFILPAGRLTFGPDIPSQTINVTATANNRADGDKTLVVRLSNPRGGGRLGAPRDATVTIVEKEQGGRIQFAQGVSSVGETPTRIVQIAVSRSPVSAALAANVSVGYRVIGGTAVAGVDYTLPPGPLVFGAGVSTLNIPLQILDNTRGDGDRTLTLELFDPRGGGKLGSTTRQTVTIVDDEQAIEFQKTDVQVDEKKGSVKLTVRRKASPSQLETSASVQFTTVAGTAGAVDFVSRNGTVTFKAKSIEETITITLQNDTLAEGDEVFFVDLSAPSPGAVLGANTRATVTILDDEQLVQLAGNVSVVEGGRAKLTVTRKGGTDTTTTVSWRTEAGGTAVAGVDYDALSGIVTFPKNNSTQTFEVPTRPDTLVNGDRTFTVRLLAANTSANSSVALGKPSQATVTITDDDAGGVVAFEPATAAAAVSETSTAGVTLSVRRTVPTGKSPAGPVRVDYAVAGGTAQAGVDFVPLAGTLTFETNKSTATILVRPIDNAAAVGDRTLFVDLANPRDGASLGAAKRATVVIEEDDQIVQFSAATYSVAEGGTATITVTRTGRTKQKIDVPYTVGPGSKSTGTLTFKSGDTERTFTVATAQDTLVDGTENVPLKLGTPLPANSGAVLGARAQATLAVIDDDQGGTIRFSAATFSATEGQTASFTVTRSGTKLASNVSVDYQVVASGSTAVAGVDYTLDANRTLRFDANQASLTFSVSTLPDGVVDGPKTLTLRLSNPKGGGSLGSPTDATLTIADANQGGVIQFGQALVGIDEGGGTASLTVTRSGTNLAGNVSVDVRVAAGGTAPSADFTLLTPTLTFGAGVSTATARVRVNDNATADGSRTVLLDLASPRGGATLGAVARATLTIADDAQVVQFTTSADAVGEGDRIKLAVTRTGPLGSKLTVGYRTVNNTAAAGVDFEGQANGTVTFPAGASTATIAVRTLQNGAFAPSALSFFVELLPGSGVQLGTRTRATVTIKDDEQKVQFADPVYTVAEGNTARLTVVRLGTPDGTVSVRYATQPGSASAKDFVAESGVVTFGPGVTSRTITIKTRDDKLAEGVETFSVVLSDAEAPLLLGTPSIAEVRISANAF